jgi:fimbrial chaperone protein
MQFGNAKGRRISPIALGLAAMIWCLPAFCGTFTVSPVRINLSFSRPNSILQVVNRNDEPATIQAHVVLWTTDGEKDVYQDTDDVMLNPPIASLGAKQTQFIRLGLRWPNETKQERSYRLVLEEVPQPLKPGFQGIRTLLRLVIPIFVSPRVTSSPRLSWEAVRTDDAHVKLVAKNLGSAHIQIKSVDLASADQPAAHIRNSQPIYLLPNQQREWLVNDDAIRLARRIALVATTDAGALHETVDVGRP